MGKVTVAVVGLGVAGLAAVKECLAAGLEVTGFDSDTELGGTWNLGSDTSKIWPSLRLNTSRRMCAYSDFPLPEPPGCDPFPTNTEFREYLERYAAEFSLHRAFRTGVRVDSVRRAATGGGRWTLAWSRGGEEGEEDFDFVVVATGNYSQPCQPSIEGSEAFEGQILHAGDLKACSFKGRRVVVQGSAISGCQLASIAATNGSGPCYHSQRSPRYHKELYAGKEGREPLDATLYTRLGVWLLKVLPESLKAKAIRSMVLDPGPAGGPHAEPHKDVRVAGVTVSYKYLDLLANGSVVAKPPIRAVQEGRLVCFEDGTSAEADVIVQATGYAPASTALRGLLPADVTELLGTGAALDVYKWTFHPEVPGLAFCGLQRAAGSIVPVAELQARWIAGVAVGSQRLPAQATMQAWMAARRPVKSVANPFRLTRESDSQGAMTEAIASEVGCLPSMMCRPWTAWALLTAPLFPAQYRIDGPGRSPGALDQVLRYTAEPLLAESHHPVPILDTTADCKHSVPIANEM